MVLDIRSAIQNDECLPQDTDSLGGIQISSNCSSIEKIYTLTFRRYAIAKLNKLKEKLFTDMFYQDTVLLDTDTPCLSIQPYCNCTSNEVVEIKVDARSGLFIIQVFDLQGS